jgi:hypothetical protein
LQGSFILYFMPVYPGALTSPFRTRSGKGIRSDCASTFADAGSKGYYFNMRFYTDSVALRYADVQAAKLLEIAD